MGNLVFEAVAGGSTTISGPNTAATNVINVPDKNGILVVSATTLDASKAVATDSTGALVSVTNTGSGNNVLATSPTLVTPNLGTPSALVGTNITGVPNSGLLNSTISGISLGNNLANLTAGTGISFSAGTTYNGSTAITINSTISGTVTGVTGTAPIISSGGTAPAISITQATTSANGYLSSTDWNTFNSKQTALVSGTNIKTVNGTSLLGSGDVSVGVLTVTGTSPVVSSGGATPAISMPAATTSVSGYLTSTDWNTFNGKGNGTVTSVGGTGTVNGITLTGSVTSSGNLTLGGTLSGIGNSQLTNSTISGVALGGSLFSLTAGTNISFSSGTTYNGSTAITINATGGGGGGGTVTSVAGTGTVNGITLTGTVTSSGSLTLGGTLGSIANSQLTNSSITFGATAAALGTTVSALNSVSIGATTASTGAFTYISTSSSTSTTPVLSFNASNAPYAAGATISGSFLQHLLQNKSGTAGASTNYVLSNDLGTDSTYYGEFGMNSSVFSSGTPADFFSINNGIYYSGHDGDVTLGSGNGFKTFFAWGTTGQSAHVINASGAIGLNTSITGSTNFGTSGQVLTSAGSGATPTWTTLAGSGTVTSVAALTLGTTGTDLSSSVANGTTTPVITLNVPTASATNRGVLSSADWTTFNGKGSGTVTSVAATVPAFLSITGSPITSSGTLAITLSGTALPVANGGTGATTLTGILKGNGTSAFTAATVGTDYVAPGTATTFTATQSFTGSSSVLASILTNAAEVCTVSATAATGTIAYYPSTQSVLYYTTNASANWTTNFTFSAGTTLNTAMSTGQSLTVAFLVTQGATAYYNNVVQVDGTTSGVTTKWQGSAAPTAGNASSVDVYTYTIVKTGSATFTVFATQTQFK